MGGLRVLVLAPLLVGVAAFGNFGTDDDTLIANIRNTYINGILTSADGRDPKPNGTGVDITNINNVIDPEVQIFIHFFNEGDGRVLTMRGHCGIRHMYSQALRQLGLELAFFVQPPFVVSAKSASLMAGFGSLDSTWSREFSNVFFKDHGNLIYQVTAFIELGEGGFFYPDAGHLFMEDPARPDETYAACAEHDFAEYIYNPDDIPFVAPAGL